MKTILLLELESKIEEFINETTDEAEDVTCDEYYHPNIVAQMALAAAQVFDATFEAQKFAKEQKIS